MRKRIAIVGPVLLSLPALLQILPRILGASMFLGGGPPGGFPNGTPPSGFYGESPNPAAMIPLLLAPGIIVVILGALLPSSKKTDDGFRMRY